MRKRIEHINVGVTVCAFTPATSFVRVPGEDGRFVLVANERISSVLALAPSEDDPAPPPDVPVAPSPAPKKAKPKAAKLTAPKKKRKPYTKKSDYWKNPVKKKAEPSARVVPSSTEQVTCEYCKTSHLVWRLAFGARRLVDANTQALHRCQEYIDHMKKVSK